MIKEETGFSMEVLGTQLGFNKLIEYSKQDFDNYLLERDELHNSTEAAERLMEELRPEYGVGYVVILDPGKPNTNKRPYSITDNPIKGTRTYTTKYELIEKDTNTIIARLDPPLENARKLAKEYYLKGGTKELVCSPIKVVKEGTPFSFIANVKLSEGSKPGKYLFFGYSEFDD